jgi:hypothetical protein
MARRGVVGKQAAGGVGVAHGGRVADAEQHCEAQGIR